MKKGLLLVISGPSGAGKGTICKRLLETDTNVKVSVSTTTRMPRVAEVEGKNYFFIDKDKFVDMKDNNEFLEYAKVYGNYYGTPRQFVMDNINRGDDVLLEIDIDGALQIKDRFEDAVFVFILPPSLKELKNRIVLRGTESKQDIDKRFSLAQGEIRQVIKYDYAVLNDDLVKAIEDIKAIIVAEKCKVMRVYEDIKKMI
ncbi:MAG: guanylate kinase [Alkaliphilus sp.]